MQGSGHWQGEQRRANGLDFPHIPAVPSWLLENRRWLQEGALNGGDWVDLIPVDFASVSASSAAPKG